MTDVLYIARKDLNPDIDFLFKSIRDSKMLCLAIGGIIVSELPDWFIKNYDVDIIRFRENRYEYIGVRFKTISDKTEFSLKYL